MSISPVRMRAGRAGNAAAIPSRAREAMETKDEQNTDQEDVPERFVDSCSARSPVSSNTSADECQQDKALIEQPFLSCDGFQAFGIIMARRIDSRADCEVLHFP